jgi:hypothetical protein
LRASEHARISVGILAPLRRFGTRTNFAKRQTVNELQQQLCGIFVKRVGVRQKKAASYAASKAERGGIRTPGPDFSRHGISSAASVGSATLGPFDEMLCHIGFARHPASPNFVKTGFVKNLSNIGRPVG